MTTIITKAGAEALSAVADDTLRHCSWCGKDIGKFRDALSYKEWGISGMCQSCQDETFGDCYEGCGH